MKKVLYFAALLFCAGMTSCEKEEIGGTATESMAGQWLVRVDAVDVNGDPIANGENYFGLDGEGYSIWLTYNTTANTASEMWIDNMGIGNFSADYADYWQNYGFFPTYTIKAKVSIDQNTFTFKSTEAENLGEGYEWWVEKKDAEGNVIKDENDEPVMELMHGEYAMPVTVDGKILKGQGRQNNGSPCDSIIMFITYKNDPWYPDDGYEKYKVSGIRYSGLVENER